MNFEKFKQKGYLLLPVASLFFWVFISLLKDGFYLYDAVDFNPFYYAGKFIFSADPTQIYTSEEILVPYVYVPFFAVLMSPLSLLEYNIACTIFLVLTITFAILSVLEFDKLLTLKSIKNPMKTIFLLVITNGILIMQMFDYLQSKFFVLYAFLYIIRLEMEKKAEDNLLKEYFLLTFVIGAIPFIIWIAGLFIFKDLDSIKNIIDKKYIKRILIMATLFIVENLHLFLVPNMLSEFLNGANQEQPLIGEITPEILIGLGEKFVLHPNTLASIRFYFNLSLKYSYFSLFSQTLVILSVVFLIFIKSLKLEEKIGVYFISTMILSNYFVVCNTFIVFLPSVLLLFAQNKDQSTNWKDFIFDNYLKLIPVVAIVIIYFMPPLYFLFEHISFLQKIPIFLLIFSYTWCYFVIVAGYLLDLKKQRK